MSNDNGFLLFPPLLCMAWHNLSILTFASWLMMSNFFLIERIGDKWGEESREASMGYQEYFKLKNPWPVAIGNVASLFNNKLTLRSIDRHCVQRTELLVKRKRLLPSRVLVTRDFRGCIGISGYIIIKKTLVLSVDWVSRHRWINVVSAALQWG